MANTQQLKLYVHISEPGTAPGTVQESRCQGYNNMKLQ